ncbi:ankyrin repeat protein [Seminavis robusta]|uniref:Ankyrin repeat protein n=1 Tax=Seminavis robusta TaxID=568900 RepID=A0A9N8DB14_9STRA|nr:ankyrin repeat protein [Seminavis robusta]|eukprot:Sro67_g037600.1 ankyrin repeat protein (216) ;mRNA; f:72713-73360
MTSESKTTMAPAGALLDQKDVWVNGILPFLGMGHYAFVGSVNMQMNLHYKECCSAVDKPPQVISQGADTKKEAATSTVTFYSAAFHNESTAEFWHNNSSTTTLAQTPPIQSVCSHVAKLGNLPVMKWAHGKGFSWDETTCSAAAKGGHFELLKWAREHGCPWDARTCDAAYESGNTTILDWAREQGCPFVVEHSDYNNAIFWALAVLDTDDEDDW